MIWWLLCYDDAVVITTAPTARQVSEMLWREIRRDLRREPRVDRRQIVEHEARTGAATFRIRVRDRR